MSSKNDLKVAQPEFALEIVPYRGCSTDLMLQQIAKAPGFLYIILHNIDGLGRPGTGDTVK